MRAPVPLRSRARVWSWLVLLALILGMSPRADAWAWAPAADATAEAGGRWEEALDRRRNILARHRGKDPAAILALLGALPELEGEIEDGRLEGLIGDVAKDRSRHPLVRSYAELLTARTLQAQGDIEAAHAHLQSQGYLVDWQILGPFDNAGRKGERAVYPPETTPFSPEQQFSGKLPGEPLGWRFLSYDNIPRAEYVSFDDLLRPNEQATGYATAWVHAPKAMPAALHVGTGGPYQLWVDGELVGEGSAYRITHPLQESHAIALAEGWNRLLVKVSALDGMWGFSLRVSNPQGSPIAGLKMTGDPTTLDPADLEPGARRRPEPRPAQSLRAALEKKHPPTGAVKRAPAQAGLDLVEFYRYVHPFDKDDETAVELARRVDAKVRSAWSAWLLSQLDREQNGSIDALRQGVERAKKEGRKSAGLQARMLLELGWRLRSLGMEERYRSLLDEAAKVAPKDPIIELAQIDRLSDDGFTWWALEQTRDLAERYPRSGTLHLDLASRLRMQDRSVEALEVLERLRGEAGAEVSPAIAQRMDILLSLGRADEAADLARALTETTPGLPEAHATLAKLEEARGDEEAALAALAKAVALAPHDFELHAEMGFLLARTGAKAAAIASLERSLQLRPQQPDIRDLIATLDDRRPADLWTRYGVELAEVGKTPTPKDWKGKDAGVLHHRVAVQVLPNGLTERLDHRIIRILDDRGIRSQAVQGMSYDPAESIVEVRRARVLRKDGSIEELGDVQEYALASAGYRMYYDQRQKRVAFGGLRVGDTLEVAFVRRDIAARNKFEDYFGDVMPIQGTEPIRKVEYVLEAPADKPIYFNIDVAKKTKDGGKTALYRFVAKDVPGIKPEPGMPGWTEVARYLHASTYRTWDDVGDWYWDLVREQLVVDENIRTAVREVLAELPPDADDATKTRALYEYVVRNTRYVGLEFGIHGYKPYRTTDVFSRRFGDCKDKASLLKVMLAEADIDSHLVLVRTRDQGTVPGKPASLSVFNHAITYVPSLDLWLDGTAEWSGPDELPANDQGASVLVVKDGKGAEFQTIPVSEAAANLRLVEQRVKLEPEGEADVVHALTVKGSDASGVRYAFQSKEQRKERLSKAFGDIYGGVEIEGVQAPGIGDIGEPARLQAQLEVPRWTTPGGGGQRFRVLGRDSRLAASMAPLETRTHPLVLDVPSTEQYRVSYVAPAGHTFGQVPKGTKIETKLGSFELDVKVEGSRAEVSSILRLSKHRITPEEYGDFRAFLRKVDEALEQTFEIVVAR